MRTAHVNPYRIVQVRYVDGTVKHFIGEVIKGRLHYGGDLNEDNPIPDQAESIPHLFRLIHLVVAAFAAPMLVWEGEDHAGEWVDGPLPNVFE